VHRLKTRPQFQAVLAGKTLAKTPHFALHSCAFDSAPDMVPAVFPQKALWLGAMVPKRWARRAVTRNTIKRQIYAVSASLKTALPEHAHLVRLRSGFDKKLFPSASSDALKASVRKELLQLFERAVQVLPSPVPLNPVAP
jgi:ribonuclease P protein component